MLKFMIHKIKFSDKSCFEDGVGPDQLASKKLIRIHTDFNSAYKYLEMTWILWVT